jgi:hypothetical protein
MEGGEKDIHDLGGGGRFEYLGMKGEGRGDLPFCHIEDRENGDRWRSMLGK